MTSALEFFRMANGILAVPSTIIFFATAIILTFKLRFLQIRGIPRFFRVVRGCLVNHTKEKSNKLLSSTRALFTAMGTTLGVGNIVGPSLAILTGGPGALFWLILYVFLSSATKFVEVTFAIKTRIQTPEGRIVGGPGQYLRLISPALGIWYGLLTMVLFPGWNALQAKTVAEIFAAEGIPQWVTGLCLATIVMIVIFGGISRVGAVASKIVPLKCGFYIFFASLILYAHSDMLWPVIKLIFTSAFTPCAPVGAFIGASVYMALRSGVYRGIYITESGIGTSSIPHALADVKRATDQGILAMFSAAADATISTLSGLLVLVTGVWLKTDHFTTRMIYDVFKLHSPVYGKYILVISISLLVFTTVLGNSLNGSQNFITFFKYRCVKLYYLFLGLVIFLGAIAHVQLVWDIMDIMLALVAIPNLIGILILAFKYPHVLNE